MKTLQKPCIVQSTQQSNFCNYSNISKLEHEHCEQGFQVFISGANKERLKIQDLQEQALQAKKAKLNNNNTLRRNIRPPNNTFRQRKFWQKNSDIKIKGSDGSKIIISNQKASKLDNNILGFLLHDITSKNIDIHSSAKKNLQLNFVRNRYKAYFHIDGHGFCCSKELSKSSTPIKYQIDRASPKFNIKSFKHLKRIQARPISSSCSPQPYDVEEQKSQYYSLLNRNKKYIDELTEFLTPDYEYFRSTREINVQDLHDNIAKETTLLDLYNGIDYDVFYHKEQNICRSVRALLFEKVLNESNSKGDDGNETNLKGEYRNENSLDKLKSHNEPCLRINMLFNKSEENGNQNDVELFNYDKRALVLHNNYEILDEFIIDNNGNKKRYCLPSLRKVESPISKLLKTCNHHVVEEKKRCLVEENHCLYNKREEKLSNNIFNFEFLSKNDDNGKENTFKLNVRYIHQDLNSNVHNITNLDMFQSYDFSEASTNFNDNESSQTTDHSTIYSSTPSNIQISPKWTNSQEQQNSKLLLEKASKQITDVDVVANNNNNTISSMCQNRHSKFEKTPIQISSSLRGEILSARVQKLDIKKQICLSHILDKLEIVHVSRSVDFFCSFGLHRYGIGREDGLYT